MSVTSVADDPASGSGNYTPVAPFSVAVTSVLSQDQVTSDDVLIHDPGAANAVATFCNPTKGGVSEAFAIVSEGGVSQVVYVSRDPSQPSGWSMAPLPGGPNGVWPATSVVAAVTGSEYGLVDVFWDDGSALQHTWLHPDGTWVTPEVISENSFGALGVSYGVTVVLGQQPVPVVYGITGEGVQLLCWSGSQSIAWSFARFTDSGFSASNPLMVGVAIGENHSGANGAKITVYSGNEYFSNNVDFSTPWSSTTAGSVSTLTVPGVSDPVQRVIGQTTNASGRLVAFPVIDDVPYAVAMTGPDLVGVNALPAATGTASEVVAVTCPPQPKDDGSVLTGTLNLYVAHSTPDGGTDLSLLRQIGWANGGTVPQWAPPVPIGADVSGIFPSACPTDPDTIFSADALNSDALKAYTNTTSKPWVNQANGVVEWGGGPHWNGGDVRQQGETTFDITSYMVQATITDANGYPVAAYPLDLTASSDCGVMVGTTNVMVNQTTVAPVTTSAGGVLTLSVIADDFVPPSLILTDPVDKIRAAGAGGNGPVSITPGASVQTYMSTPAVANQQNSTGVLPYLPASSQSFGAPMMSGAQTGGGSALFPGVQGSSPNMSPSDAVTNVNNMMQLGYSPVGDTAGPRAPLYEPAPGSPVAFIVNNSDPTRPPYLTFESGDAMRTAWRAQHQPRFHLLHAADHVMSDAWKGIKEGATKVADVAVDVEKGVVSMAIWVGKEATEIGDFVITCVEDACNAITAVFSALEAAIKDVIDFLKALFDFGHVFDSQWAFTQSLNEGLFTAQELVQWGIQQLDPTGSGSTTFFADRVDQINAVVQQAAQVYGDQSVQQAAGPGWQPMGQPPSNTQDVPGSGTAAGGGPITPAQLTANPQAQWLQSKLGAQVGSQTTDVESLLEEFFTESLPPALTAAIDTFTSDFDDAVAAFDGGVEAFEAAFVDMANAVLAAIKAIGSDDPSNLQNVALTDLIDAAHELIIGMVDFGDAIALSFLALIDAALTWLLDTINSEIPEGKDSPFGILGSLVQALYDGLWDLAHLSSWKPPTGGWTPPSGSSIPGWNPQDGMKKELTYAGLVGLLIGFPYTVLYEIVTGKEPFPGGVLPVPGSDSELDQRQWGWVGFGVDLAIGLLTTLRDGVICTAKDLSKTISGLSFLIGLASASSFIFKWPAKGTSWEDSALAKGIAFLQLATPGAMTAFALLMGRSSRDDPSNLGLGLIFSGLLGSLTLVYAIQTGMDAHQKLPPSGKYTGEWQFDMSIGVISAFVPATSFLLLPALQEATEDVPLAGTIKCVLDIAFLTVAVPTLELTNALTQPES